MSPIKRGGWGPHRTLMVVTAPWTAGRAPLNDLLPACLAVLQATIYFATSILQVWMKLPAERR